MKKKKATLSDTIQNSKTEELQLEVQTTEKCERFSTVDDSSTRTCVNEQCLVCRHRKKGDMQTANRLETQDILLNKKNMNLFTFHPCS